MIDGDELKSPLRGSQAVPLENLRRPGFLFHLHSLLILCTPLIKTHLLGKSGDKGMSVVKKVKFIFKAFLVLVVLSFGLWNLITDLIKLFG